jgi:hypothetical protein
VNEKMLNEGNKILNFISSFGSGTVINYGSGSGSDFLTSYGSGSTSQKITVPSVPVPVPQRWDPDPELFGHVESRSEIIVPNSDLAFISMQCCIPFVSDKFFKQTQNEEVNKFSNLFFIYERSSVHTY